MQAVLVRTNFIYFLLFVELAEALLEQKLSHKSLFICDGIRCNQRNDKTVQHSNQLHNFALQGLCITWTVSFYFCLSFWQAFQCFECSLHEEYNITTTIVLQEAASIVLFAVISVYCQQHENLFVFVLETLINLKRGGTYLKCA